MHELSPFHDVHLLEAVLDEVLHCLHVMVGHLLDLLDLCSILRCHVPVDVSQSLEFRRVEISKLRQRNLAEGDKVFDLYPDTVFDECIFAEIFSKWLCLTRIASVDRRYCQK